MRRPCRHPVSLPHRGCRGCCWLAIAGQRKQRHADQRGPDQLRLAVDSHFGKDRADLRTHGVAAGRRIARRFPMECPLASESATLASAGVRPNSSIRAFIMVMRGWAGSTRWTSAVGRMASGLWLLPHAGRTSRPMLSLPDGRLTGIARGAPGAAGSIAAAALRRIRSCSSRDWPALCRASFPCWWRTVRPAA